MFRMFVVLNVIVISFFCEVYSISTPEYYQHLINQRTAAAENYELPSSNEEFRIGIDSSDTVDIGNYDFIIIGAGSAGSVLATRLSEIHNWNILLLEAGMEEDDFNAIPSMFMYLQLSEMNWGYYSTPQTTCCLGMKDKRCAAPRGKSIGGSSAINAALYSRGNPKDFDKWAELGNPGWSFEEVLPYFIKSENSQINGDPGYHGQGGYWNVEYSRPVTELFSSFIEGNEELNGSIIDYNGQRELGVSKIQFNIKRGRRESAGQAFLGNARARENLKIITKAFVIKIDINEQTKTAEGVIFVTNHTKFVAKATKEVLVSGGAINSPQLLMLSGIGPKKHLEEIGIKVIEDLPVGENLLEHPALHSLIFHTNSSNEPDDIKIQIKEYLNGFGQLTNSGGIDAIGFTSLKNNRTDVPMIEYMFCPLAGSMSPSLDKIYNYDDELKYKFLDKINPNTDILFYLILLHQKSKGRVTLKSSNPIDFPNIDLNLFSQSEDIDNFIEGIEFVLKLSQTEAFQKLNASLIDIPICEEFEKFSKPFWECVIRHMASTLFHPCGTTAMGPDRTTSVVDTNLKVHGIEKLRVVDAGVFPSTISGHTNAPTIMVAEKISDVIKHDYGTHIKRSPLVNIHSSSSLNHCFQDKDSCYLN